MTDEWLSLIQCPACRKQAWQATSTQVVRAECSAVYPIVEGVPFVVKAADGFLQSIQRRAEKRQEWFEGDQLQSYNLGPYRYTYRKRIEYYTKALITFLDTTSVVLDFACGDGGNLRELMRLRHRVLLGVDYNHVRLMRARGLVENREAVFLGVSSRSSSTRAFLILPSVTMFWSILSAMKRFFAS